MKIVNDRLVIEKKKKHLKTLPSEAAAPFVDA